MVVTARYNHTIHDFSPIASNKHNVNCFIFTLTISVQATEFKMHNTHPKDTDMSQNLVSILGNNENYRRVQE